MAIFSNISSTIGSTPLVRLNRICDNIEAEILAKLEFFNPLGSVKDRIAASMIRAAEAEGLMIKPRLSLSRPVEIQALPLRLFVRKKATTSA